MDADAILDRRRLKRRLVFWRVVAAVAVMALLALGVGKYVSRDDSHVARLSIDGFISEDPERGEAIENLVDRDDVAAVIVRINSPGGTTTGSEQIYQGLRRVAAEKPVVAVIGTIGTSGGYIVAIAADHIIARETSLTGSIGVLFQTAEFTGLLDKLGIQPITLKSSPLKGQPSPLEPVTDDVRKALDVLLKDSFAWFSGLVRDRRKLDAATLKEATDGRVFSGRQAMKLDLIDALGGERAARRWLDENHEISEDLETRNVRWGEEAGLLARTLDTVSGKLFKNERLTLDGLLSVWQP
ncbi:MAG: signal peptide peptidase SppA [Rhodospirillaceae bacterium]|jgi:protease IV|nr:signal peptide peptidase SppA [Alphaproteobacteria bacterium]MBT3532293.1 signal peptide peptidase SppA [Rhodospirillaceae bacterium]MBT4491412.1 signal peptide peptidase SppA [Rhodospirillaceae bacterium]MBT5195401.1 signal peptide peptidase SppA [Rhodospirillaceae bacterium]MBT5898624.1 signal peptide peptidase SppA [Rhodospirillaceae bacterium]